MSPDATVRVRLFGTAQVSEVTVEAVGQSAEITVGGVPAGTIAAGDDATISRRGSEVRVRFGGTERSGRNVRIEAAELRVRSGRADRRYPRAIVALVEDGALRVVNHVPMNPYVASVVASELNFREIEAAKAQAVLARTYAARRAGEHAAYDLADDQSAQVYRGLGTITETSQRAADETAGEVLTYYGALADAYYFSSSGGHTADNEAVWDGTPVPYLRGVADPFDTSAPDHQWRTSADRSAVLRTLSARYGGSVEGIEIMRRSRSGRVLRVGLLGGARETISGSQLRRAVNATAGPRTVRSTKFDVRLEGDRYVFSGGGFGHGVGMSQYGALGLSRAGRDYREILDHYFAGTTVSGAGLPALAVHGGRTPRHETQLPAEATPGASIPREPSALRTRYQPTTARRWPTPRRVARERAQAEASAPATPILPPPAPVRTTPAPRRTAW